MRAVIHFLLQPRPGQHAFTRTVAGLVLGFLAVPMALAQPIVTPNPSAPGPVLTQPSPTPALPTGPELGIPNPGLQLAPGNGTLVDPVMDPVFEVEPVEGSPSDVLPKWKFNFGAELVGFYQSNIFITSKNEVEDFILELSPYIELAWGDYRDREASFGGLKYTATGRHYTKNDDFNRVDHDAVLTLQIQLAKTRLNFDFLYRSLSTPDFDLGGLKERQIFSGSFFAEYQLTGKTSIEAGVTAALKDSETGFDSEEYFGELWLNSFVRPKLRLGLGFVGGILEQEGSSEQTYGQALLRANYTLTEKVSLRAKVGLDYRDVSSEKINFVGSLGLVYRPKETRQFSLDFARTIASASSQGATNIVGTRVTARAEQLLFQRVRLKLAVGYTNADYQVTDGSSFRLPRTDNIFFITPEIVYRLRHWMAFSVYYTYTQNDSTRDSVSFDDQVVGFRIYGDF